jgi:hypothetical protein
MHPASVLTVLRFVSALVVVVCFSKTAGYRAPENGEAACVDLAIAYSKLQSELAALRSVCGPRVAADQLELSNTADPTRVGNGSGAETGQVPAPMQGSIATQPTADRQCATAGSAFEQSRPECNCLGEPKHTMLERRPGVINIGMGDWLGSVVDAQLLKIIIEEGMGFPAAIVSDVYDNTTVFWAAMSSGEVHPFPEVWTSEEDGRNFERFVLTERTVKSAGTSDCLQRAIMLFVGSSDHKIASRQVLVLQSDGHSVQCGLPRLVGR